MKRRSSYCCSSSTSKKVSSANITNIELKDHARLIVDNWQSGSGMFVQNSSKGIYCIFDEINYCSKLLKQTKVL